MESKQLANRLNQIVPKSVLERKAFGRAGIPSLWVETSSLPLLAGFLAAEAPEKLDWLENLSFMHLDGAIVASYFVRSSVTSEFLILRCSVKIPDRPERSERKDEPKSKVQRVAFPDLSAVWTMAKEFQEGAAELFGIDFTGDGSAAGTAAATKILPPGWDGFPLRKDYIFPKEVSGIQHARAPGRSHGT